MEESLQRQENGKGFLERGLDDGLALCCLQSFSLGEGGFMGEDLDVAVRDVALLLIGWAVGLDRCAVGDGAGNIDDLNATETVGLEVLLNALGSLVPLADRGRGRGRSCQDHK